MATGYTTPLPLSPARLRPLPHLVRAVWLESLRRNEMWVLGLLLGLYAAAALVLRIVGIESPQSARFIRGLGFDLGGLLASLLVIVTAARQLPVEIELRTIYPVLAKPVRREALLWGKALPTWGLGVAALTMFCIATVALTPTLPQQSALVLMSALLLKALSLAILTAMTMCVSLWLPPAVTMLLCGAIAFGGRFAANFVVQLCGEGRWGNWLAALWPDLSLLGQFQRYVDGGALPAPSVLLALMVYALVWTFVFAMLAAGRFRRMPI
ncbi:hypothetical protein LLG95_18990 [bacterium]|nr:hypothetical protein [bacterium]